MKTASEIINFCNNQHRTEYSNGNSNVFTYYSRKLNRDLPNLIKFKRAIADDLSRCLRYNEDEQETNDLKTLFEFLVS